jgi:Flp pilus assembly protein TadG
LESLRRFIRSGKGGAAVELAVVFPIILLLIIAVVDYGRVFYTAVTVSNAARAGAEWGAQGPVTSNGPITTTDTVGMKSFAQSDGAEAGTLTVTPRVYCLCGGVSHSCNTKCADNSAPEVYTEITARKDVSMLIPYPGLRNPLVVRRTAVFRSQ